MPHASAAFDALPAEWKAVYFGGMFVVILGIVVGLLLFENRKKQ